MAATIERTFIASVTLMYEYVELNQLIADELAAVSDRSRPPKHHQFIALWQKVASLPSPASQARERS